MGGDSGSRDALGGCERVRSECGLGRREWGRTRQKWGCSGCLFGAGPASLAEERADEAAQASARDEVTADGRIGARLLTRTFPLLSPALEVGGFREFWSAPRTQGLWAGGNSAWKAEEVRALGEEWEEISSLGAGVLPIA